MSLDQEGDRIKVSVDPDLEPLIPAFLQHRRLEIKLLQDAVEHSDYKKIKMMGHTIKGVGGGYGFKDLAKIAACIELAAMHQDFQETQNALKDLVDHLGRVDVVYERVSEEPLIICVDDEPSMLRLLERTLTKNGFRVMGSLGGDNALSLIHRYKPDLILMDIKMPGIDGHQMCARLQESGDVATIPVIFVTGLSGENDRAEAISSGASDVLFKPFDLEVLVQKTRKTLQTI